MTDTGTRLISLNQVCEITSLSRTAVNKLRSKKRFPAAVHLGEKRIAFVRQEVDQWVAERVGSRDGEAAR